MNGQYNRRHLEMQIVPGLFQNKYRNTSKQWSLFIYDH